MNKKLTYEQPSCDLFVIKVEENFLASIEGKSIQTLEYDDDELNC